VSKNISEIPYTELQERVKSLARVPENSKEKIRGVIQDVYLREIPSKFDWDFLWASSSLTSVAAHNLGTVSINTGTTALSFSNDAALTAQMTGRKISISGNPVVYDFTQTTGSDGTLKPSFEGATNATNASYKIYQPKYPLSKDFDRFPKGGGLYRWEGQQKRAIPEEPYQEGIENFQGSPSPTQEKVRVVEPNTAGVPQIEFRPAPSQARNYGYDYLRQVAPLTETSAGVATIAANGTAVTGNASCRFTDATTGDFFRISDFGKGQDSSWYRILAIQHDSSLTLATAFENSGATNANYCISKAPEFPNRLHPGVLYGAIRALTLDQTDQSFSIYQIKLAEVMSDAKRIHVSRVYSQKIPTIAEDYLYRR